MTGPEEVRGVLEVDAAAFGRDLSVAEEDLWYDHGARDTT